MDLARGCEIVSGIKSDFFLTSWCLKAGSRVYYLSQNVFVYCFFVFTHLDCTFITALYDRLLVFDVKRWEKLTSQM